MVLFQHVVVDAGTVVETVGVGDGGQLAQGFVALFVFGQEDKVVAAAV